MVDRAEFPREKACAEYMSPETVRILDRLGVVEQLEDRGASHLEGMKFTGCEGATAHGLFGSTGWQPYRPTGLSISRRILDHELVKTARGAGALILEQTSIAGLLVESGAVAGVVVRDRDGSRHSIRARLTVGADGLRSTVARRLGRRIHGSPRRIAFVAHIAGVQGMSRSAELHFGRTGYVGLNRIEGDRVNVALVIPGGLAAGARGNPDDFFFRALAGFPAVSERVQAGKVVRPVMVTGPFAAWSSTVAAPSCVLVGDAADFYDPVTGDGIYSALRGAELVAETMLPALERRGPVTLETLRQYVRLRRRVFAGKWLLERVSRYLMHFPRVFDRVVAGLGRHRDLAHTAIGVAGGFVPVREILNPGVALRVVF